MSIKVGFVNLGCPKNLVDSERMLDMIVTEGWELVSDESTADAIVVNTCAFIDEAKSEAIENILEIAKFKKEGKLRALVVAGCLSERYRETLYEDLPEIDAVIGVKQLGDIVNVIKFVLEGGSKPSMDSYVELRRIYESRNTEPHERLVSLTPPHWAYLKIADGCNNRCSYCVIPSIRGPYESETIEVLVAKAWRLARSGVKELNLIAQDTTLYGKDLFGRPRLPDLLRELEKVEGIEWIRLLYLYPGHLEPELIDYVASSKKTLHYFDLPFQHISGRLLKKMNRQGTPEELEEIVERIREKMPDACIRSTFIVGFPGETDEDIDMLASFLKKHRFDRVGFFRYSQEEGTPAARMRGQVPEDIKHERLKYLLGLQRRISREKNRLFIGKKLLLLGEFYESGTGVLLARSYRDAPEVDGNVSVTGSRRLRMLEGAIFEATVTSASDYDLTAGVNE